MLGIVGGILAGVALFIQHAMMREQHARIKELMAAEREATEEPVSVSEERPFGPGNLVTLPGGGEKQ